MDHLFIRGAKTVVVRPLKELFLCVSSLSNISIFVTEVHRPVLVYIHGGAFMFGSGSACW